MKHFTYFCKKISTKHQTYTFNLIQFDMIKIKKKPWLAILPAILSLFFISCNNSDNDSETNNLKIETILQEYATIHNSGLDYIKNRVASTSQDQKLDSIFKAYVHFKYGNDKAINILDKIAPLTKKYFQSSSLSEVCARSSYGGDNSALQNNKFVSEALHVCMDEIRNRMSNVSDNEVFDNKLLLTDLHSIRDLHKICK